jgi:hypothetical protein
MSKLLFILIIAYAYVTTNFSSAEITGKNKIAFENEYIPTCIQMQSRNVLNKNFSFKEIKEYCQCASNHIVERASVADLNGSTDRLRKIVEDAGILCTGKVLMNR